MSPAWPAPNQEYRSTQGWLSSHFVVAPASERDEVKEAQHGKVRWRQMSDSGFSSHSIHDTPQDHERTHEIVHLLFTCRLRLTAERVAGEFGEPDGQVECVVNGSLRAKVIPQQMKRTREETGPTT